MQDGALRLWKLRYLGGDALLRNGRVSHIVDDVVDYAQIIKSHRDHVVEADAGSAGRLDSVVKHNIRMPEDRVDAESPGLVASHFGGYLIGCPSVHPRSAQVAGLVRRIIGNFGLIEVGSAAIAVPQHLNCC